MTTIKRIVGFAGIMLLAAGLARGDGLKIGKVSLAPRDAKTATATFDIAWTNTYRFGRYHDAVWVFFKVKPAGAKEWRHAPLAADKMVNPAGFAVGEGTPLEFVAPTDHGGCVGMFVRLARDGRDGVSARKVTAILDLSLPTTDNRQPATELRAFGVEMTYVGEGPFYLGTDRDRINRFFAFTCTDDPAERPAYRVTSPGAIPTGRQKGKLWAAGLMPEDNSEIPAAFPTGYSAFYCMKRPYFTQELYADFLNTLTPEQAGKRWYSDGQGRSITRGGTAPDQTFTPTQPEAPTLWVSWEDNACLAAWAGLRPMSELEFEKAVRGDEYPENNDAGFSFWGLQEINLGNVYERQVSVATAAGRRFAGTHGRGTVDLPQDWPSALNRDVVYRGAYMRYRRYTKVGHMGTGGRSDACNGRSDRFSILGGESEKYAGWRGARTAPEGDPIVRALPQRLDSAPVRTVARANAPLSLDKAPEGMGQPIALLATGEDVMPFNSRCLMKYQERILWGGPTDVSATVFLAWDETSLYVGAEVTDDRHWNAQSGESIWNGDAIQFGILTSSGAHWNLVAALTTNGVAMHQFAGPNQALCPTVTCSVKRDDTTKVTRYGVRLPLTSLGLEPGDEFGFNSMVCDGDDDKGMRYSMRMAYGINYPFQPRFYPRFALKE